MVLRMFRHRINPAATHLETCAAGSFFINTAQTPRFNPRQRVSNCLGGGFIRCRLRPSAMI